jgi:glycosyltransferase involved in cell wall biosynthesis
MDSNLPRTSVIIPSFNYSEYLPAAIDSVLGQTDGDFELLVVDDGSTDGSRAVVQACSDPRVRLLVQPHRGRGAARNTGLRAARGGYVAFLDADDIWTPDKLALQCAVLDGRPEIGLVYSRYGVITAAGRVTSKGRSYLAPKPSGAIFEHLLSGNVIGTPSTICFRRELVTEQKVFVDETHTYREDWHFFLRLVARALVYYQPRTLAYHRQHTRNAQGHVSVTMRESLHTAEFGLEFARNRLGFDDRKLRRLERRVQAYIEAIAGREYVKSGRWAEARAHAARSLRHYPWNIAEWSLLLLTSVGWAPNALKHRLK